LAAEPLLPAPRAKAYAAAHSVAYALLDRLLQEAGKRPAAEIAHTAAGRPFLPNRPDIDFSISHTDSAAFCLLAVTDSEKCAPSVGIDAEPLSFAPEKAKRLAKRYFAPQEMRYFKEKDETTASFLEVFTAKEALGKNLGVGLAKVLKIDTVCPLFLENHGFKFHRMHILDHIVTLCLPADCTAEIFTSSAIQ
jgi:phosphopantetheinyl transferase